jgi:hypothetical protein
MGFGDLRGRKESSSKKKKQLLQTFPPFGGSSKT